MKLAVLGVWLTILTRVAWGQGPLVPLSAPTPSLRALPEIAAATVAVSGRVDGVVGALEGVNWDAMAWLQDWEVSEFHFPSYGSLAVLTNASPAPSSFDLATNWIASIRESLGAILETGVNWSDIEEILANTEPATNMLWALGGLHEVSVPDFESYLEAADAYTNAVAALQDQADELMSRVVARGEALGTLRAAAENTHALLQASMAAPTQKRERE